MTKSILNQLDYTRIFLEAANIEMIYFEYYCKDLWWNHTDTKNLRLTRTGIDFVVKKTKLPVYQIPLNDKLRSKDLIALSRLFTCPYYITKLDQLMLLGEEETVLLKLHADNLQQYLDNLQL